jgi:ATP-dependent Clp protease protease subunit
MAEVYSARSGQTIGKVRGYMDEERRMNGKEAVALGFADDFLAADQIKEGEQTGPEAAYKRLDLILARSGVSRTERRALLKEITGTPSAADEATPSAGEQQSDAHLRELLAILKA